MGDKIQLTPFLTEEWLQDRSLAILVLSSLNRDDVDAFVGAVIRILNNWPAERPIRILYDTRAVGVSMYLRERSEFAAKVTPDRLGRAAFLLQKSPIHRIAEIMINRHILVRSKKYLERRVFFEYDIAMAWLNETF